MTKEQEVQVQEDFNWDDLEAKKLWRCIFC